MHLGLEKRHIIAQTVPNVAAVRLTGEQLGERGLVPVHGSCVHRGDLGLMSIAVDGSELA